MVDGGLSSFAVVAFEGQLFNEEEDTGSEKLQIFLPAE